MCVVMDMVTGGDLSTMSYRDPLMSDETAASYCRQIADALDYMHNGFDCSQCKAKGKASEGCTKCAGKGTVPVVHCDLKPENILLTEDKKQIRIIDFGAAKYGKAG